MLPAFVRITWLPDWRRKTQPAFSKALRASRPDDGQLSQR